MSWEFISKPDLENNMFRLYELYDEKIDNIQYTEEELEVIKMLDIEEESGIE